MQRRKPAPAFPIPRLRALALGFASICISATPRAQDVHHDTERELPLLNALSEVQALDLDTALTTVESLVKRAPEFRLAQLVYADLLLAKAQTPALLGAESGEYSDIRDLLSQARARWQHQALAHPEGYVPAQLLELPADQPTVLLVDARASRLYVFENAQGNPRLVGDYYVSIGKNGFEKQFEGDKKTPLGVYHVTEHLAGNTLPPFYGVGAFPLNYPNEWDRHQGKTGKGIWLHGNPLNTYDRPPLASDGCVTLSNVDFKELQKFIHIAKTPVVIAPEVQWVAPQQVAAVREELGARIKTWAADWSSRDSDRYLSHYAPDFFSPERDYRQWQEYKRAVNAQKQFIDVAIDGISMVVYPERQTLVMVEFDQTYRSDQLRSQSAKRQWWRKEPTGQWRIVYEGPA